MNKLIRLPALAGLICTVSHAQFVLTGADPVYTQNFDTLAQSGTVDWVQNSATNTTNGLVGWYADTTGTTPSPFQIAGTNGGVTTTGQLKSYGATGSSDRALGTLPGDTAGSMRIAVRFVNNTGQMIENFTVTYDGEQWRQSGETAVNNQFTFGYRVFDAGLGSIGATGYTAVSELTFNTPKDGTGTGTGQSLDGNLAENHVASISGSILGLSVAPGQEIWLRWFDSNSSGIDHGISIDNLSVSFSTIPEPSAFAALAGLFTLGLAATRRQRRA